jgi:hypothetical protein
VSLDFATADGPIQPQHYAFLISEAEMAISKRSVTNVGSGSIHSKARQFDRLLAAEN